MLNAIGKHRHRTVLITAAVLAVLATLLAAPAAATPTLTVGMPLGIDGHVCSLGFFGFNSRGERFAVTAAHCGSPGDTVHPKKSRATLGRVVSTYHDAAPSELIRPRGFLLIRLAPKWSIQPFFANIGQAQVGDWIAKAGERTGVTQGRIISTHDDPQNPQLSILQSDIMQTHGDSGSPWYTDGPTLVGMASSGSQDTLGGYAGLSQAQPIEAVVTLIRADPSGIGQDFRVILQ